jgi:hypothetical protein
MTAMESLIANVTFPRKGDFFSMVCTGWKDNSYKDTIFKCTASDASRVVCEVVHGAAWHTKPQVFYRADWQFDDVSALLEALGLTASPEQASAA